MGRGRNALGLVIVFFVMMIVLLFYYSMRISKYVESIDQPALVNQQKPQAGPEVYSKVIPKVKKPLHKLVPEDPAKYGIVSIQSRSFVGKFQFFWDERMERLIEKTGVFSTREGKKMLKEIKDMGGDFNKKIESINNNIASLEKEYDENPSDKKIQRRLNSLYKLKAFGEILKKKSKE